MPRKLNSSPVALVERAVLAAVANARDKGWRQSQMEMFAQRLGDYRIAGYGIDLERECIRIVRTLGCRYARKLLNWFRAVKVLPAFQPAAINFPIGIPKASRFGEMKVQVASDGSASQFQNRPVSQFAFAAQPLTI